MTVKMGVLLLFVAGLTTVKGQNSLFGTVYFPFNGSRLTNHETRKLKAGLQKNQQYILKGFTDTCGTEAYNQRLSAKRVKSVHRFLKKNLGINLIDTFSLGENFVTGYGNEKDRRVEIWQTEKKTGSATKKIKERYSFPQIFFLPYQAIVRPGSVKNLEALFEKVQTIKSNNIEIRGHINWPITGNNTKIPDNYKPLSEARAKAIYDYLVQKGVDPHRLRYAGMGNSQMLFPYATTEAEMFQNMRVEIVVLEE